MMTISERIIDRLKQLSMIHKVAFLSIGLLSACAGTENKEPEQVVEFSNDSWVVDEYFQDIDGYEKVEYECIYFDWNDRLAVGPTDYRYRGIIYLTDGQASDLLDQYEWEEMAKAPDFEFEKVDVEAFGSDPWYHCQKFEDDYLSTVTVYYVVFDGNNLVFDIQQY